MSKFATTSDGYLWTLEKLVDDPQFVVSPRGLASRELTDWQFTVANPSPMPLMTACPERNVTMAKYLAAEVSLYDSGERRAEVWAEKASKFWLAIADADGMINSNYGWLMTRNQSLPGGLTPWDWAREKLLADQDTRQAYVRVSLPEHQYEGNLDQVCTIHLMFMIREGKLNATSVMRSCDVVRGLAYDMPWFCLCLDRMAVCTSRPVGTYTHFAHSMHLYEKDLRVALAMLGRK